MTGNRSSIVWSERADQAGAYLQLDDAAFLGEVARRFGDQWGALSLEGPRWSYPLAMHLAMSYVAPRFALAGDAAHGVHPIAGQGLNLGLRDAAALSEVVADARSLGLDIGSETALAPYQSWRRFDNALFTASFDALNRLFSNDIAPVAAVRRMGLDIVDSIAPLKRFFMGQASDGAVALPKLMRG
jgi:2-octaprenyl-6-methoxyphenol hydroxylase